MSSTQFSAQRIHNDNGNGAVHIDSSSQCSTMYTKPLWQCLVCQWFNIAPSSRCISCSTERPSHSLSSDHLQNGLSLDEVSGLHALNDLMPPDWAPLGAFHKLNDHDHGHQRIQSGNANVCDFATSKAPNLEISGSKSCGRQVSGSCFSSMESASRRIVGHLGGDTMGIHSNL